MKMFPFLNQSKINYIDSWPKCSSGFSINVLLWAKIRREENPYVEGLEVEENLPNRVIYG